MSSGHMGRGMLRRMSGQIIAEQEAKEAATPPHAFVPGEDLPFYCATCGLHRAKKPHELALPCTGSEYRAEDLGACPCGAPDDGHWPDCQFASQGGTVRDPVKGGA